MYITNVTNGYDNITSINGNSTWSNCTHNDNNENNIEIIIPLFSIMPCGLSLICLTSLIWYIH